MAQGQNITGGNATAGNLTDVKFLFIQGAQSGSISEANATTSTLELSDVSDKTILFSDRPDRVVGSANTSDFIDNWNIGATATTKTASIGMPNEFGQSTLVIDDDGDDSYVSGGLLTTLLVYPTSTGQPN